MNYENILNRIRNKEITEQKIMELKGSDIDKTILLFAYYEYNKLNYQLLNLIKTKKEEYADNAKNLEILKKLIIKSKQKEMFFNMEFYIKLCSNVAIYIKFLTKEARYEEAIKVCEREEYLNNRTIQSQRISLLIHLKRLDEALSLCDNPYYCNHGVIQGLKVKILRLQHRYEEAITICENPEYQNISHIQLQHILILKKLNKLDKALDICSQECFLNSPHIQYQRIKILVELGRTEEALEISNNPELKKSEPIQDYIGAFNNDGLKRVR